MLYYMRVYVGRKYICQGASTRGKIARRADIVTNFLGELQLQQKCALPSGANMFRGSGNAGKKLLVARRVDAF